MKLLFYILIDFGILFFIIKPQQKQTILQLITVILSLAYYDINLKLFIIAVIPAKVRNINILIIPIGNNIIDTVQYK